MRNLTVRLKLLIAVGGLVIGYLFMLGLVQWNNVATTGYVARASTSLFPAALACQEAEARFNKAGQLYRNGVMTHNTRDLDAADREIGATLEVLDRAVLLLQPNPSRRANAAAIRLSLRDLREPIRTLDGLRAQAPTTSPELVARNEALTTHAIVIAVAFQDLRTDLNRDFDAEMHAMSAWSARSRRIGLAAFLMAAAWASIALLLLERRLVRPAAQLAAGLRDIASGRGDLTRRLPVESRDELGDASQSFNHLMDHLQTILRHVARNASTLGDATVEIAATASGIAHRAHQSRTETGKTEATIRDMMRGIEDAAQTSTTAAQMATDAASTARHAGRSVQETIQTMRSVLQALEVSVFEVRQVGSNSGRIAHAVDLIQRLAGQAHLLSLNAAIEAAHAGPTGAGFVIVAAEIKLLSNATAEAATSILKTLIGIDRGTTQAVETIEHGVAHIQAGVQATIQTGDSLLSIVDAVDRGSHLIAGVAEAARHQADATTEVAANLSRIVADTAVASEGADTLAASNAELKALALSLQTLIGQFRLA